MKKTILIVLFLITAILIGVVFAGLDAKDGKIINVATPTDPTDAANMQYVLDTSAAPGHNMLSVAHGDSTTDTVTRGSLIYGNSTPAWDELDLGASGTILRSDGTDAGWAATTNITTLGTIATGTWQGDVIAHEYGGLEADVSGYTDGLYGMAGGATADIDTIAEIETAIGGTNILTEIEIDASSELLALMDDETGTGALVFGTSPTFTTSASLSDGFRLGDSGEPNIIFDETNDDLELYGGDLTFIQNKTDSTTGFQIKDSTGAIVGNFDTINIRFGIGTTIPGGSLDAGGWTGRPSPISSHSNIAGDLFVGSTGTNIGRFRFSSNSSEGFLQWNRYYTGAGGAQMDTTKPSFGILLSGADDWIKFFRSPAGSTTLYSLMTILGNGNIGFNDGSPETFTEWTSTVPYLTLHNSTHEDTDGGRESRLNFKGEQSGGEETTLVRIEAGHDGAVDDEKGYLDIYINDGNDGDSPTKYLRIDSTGGVFFYNLKSGVNQAGAGAAANELWVDTDDDNTVKLGS